MVREHGQLVEKAQFFSEVWDGVVVTEGVLTQRVKDTRQQLGDDAANPCFIQTVLRHGYRFIGDVELGPAKRNPGRLCLICMQWAQACVWVPLRKCRSVL